jgi:hypothetical protein
MQKEQIKKLVAKHRSRLGVALVVGFTFANAVALVAIFASLATSR